MTREDSLLCALLQLLEHKKAWQGSQLDTLPDVFREAVLATVDLFQAGDIPRECLRVFKIVERMKGCWDEFELYASLQDKIPRQPFWSCLSEIENELTYAPPSINDQPIEPISQLAADKVTPRQIAVIYSHEGKGPFMKNGQPQEYLVRQEIAKPGSVLGEDFVHPRILAEQERLQRYDNYIGRRAQALREQALEMELEAPELPVTAPVGVETIEELLMANVEPKQIMKIKRCTQAEIDDAKLRLEAAKRENLTPADLAELETAVEAYLGQHPKATNAELAEKLGVETKIVAGIRRKLKESATAQ